MGELAARLGLKKASLFHHFPTKEAVYEEILEDLVERLALSIREAAESGGTVEERIDALSASITSTLASEPAMAALLLREVMHVSTDGDASRTKLVTRVVGVLESARKVLVDASGPENVDRDVDPTHAILSLLGAHLVPFALADVVERFAGMPPSHPAFAASRVIAVRDQTKRLILERRR